MKCCANCFGDHILKEIIITRSDEVGTCSYCGTHATPLIPPELLADVFGPLISVYEPDPAVGALLVEWMQKDWKLFEQMDVPGARSLLGDILDDGEIVRRQFSFSPRYYQEGLHLHWDRLRDELMFKNRYFPEANVDHERLEALVRLFEMKEVPSLWYRARVQQDGNLFPIDKMGAPPAAMASHGRANPAGIPYLYLGSAQDTAVAEIRPHTGEVACVADFKLDEGLLLVDLRNPRKLMSPFLFGDEDQIAALRNDIPFIERLGQELTTPVLPQRAAIEYVPSQYLCEFIKKIGYDGVVYSSSVSTGMNLALFDPAKAKARVRSIMGTIEKLQERMVDAARKAIRA